LKIIEGFQSAKEVLSRQAKQAPDADEREQAVRQIISEVRRRGDVALLDYTLKFDGVKLTSLEVSKEQIKVSRSEVDSELLSALRLAAERIESFHTAQRDSLLRESAGADLGWLIRPLQNIGIYSPGGTVSYPSTVLMTAIPAKVAGVKEVVMVTPPRKDGTVHPAVLAAADIAGVDRVFSVGGAQAIAALAFGTETIPKVDKICGPGNIYVTIAKRLVYGEVGIDGLYGPSEVIIIADETANPEYCAADLLAQAEHDPLAKAILITTSRPLADGVNREIEEQLKQLSRRDIATESLENNGLIAVVASVDEAIELSNLYAPEHLCLVVDKAASYIDKISNSGCLFVGENSVEVLVDYVAGPSHVLPTEGTARFGSPLNVTDFVKLTSLVNMDKASLKALAKAAAIIARAEGLEAHARAAEKRLNKKDK
jgi:histidinol dehydrogenase